MKESNCPLALWHYCVEQRALINSLTAKDSFNLNGTTPHTALTGEEGDISNICTFKWYKWCYSREQKMSYSFNKEMLGHVLGPAKGEGNEMAQWIMKGNGNVVLHQTLRLLNLEKLKSKIKIRSYNLFDLMIERGWGTSIKPPLETTSDNWDPYKEYEVDDEIARSLPETEETVDANGTLND
eukprot:9333716-Ditylum_brightwellii.AAC.2